MKKEIIKKIEESIKALMETELEVGSFEVPKNDGSVQRGVTIREPGLRFPAFFYLDEALEGIEDVEKAARDLAKEILDVYQCDMGRFLDIEGKLSKESVLENVVCQLINTDRNEELLRRLVHKEFLDLSIIYKVLMINNGSGRCSFTVNHELCDMYGISEEELDRAARKNTKARGFCVRPLVEIVSELMNLPFGAVMDGCVPLFAITSKDLINGAAAMLYKERFDELAKKLESDLYVLPSSVQEVIVMPADGNDPSALKSIVAEVNANVVGEEEFLSGSVYKYNAAAGIFSIEE